MDFTMKNVNIFGKKGRGTPPINRNLPLGRMVTMHEFIKHNSFKLLKLAQMSNKGSTKNILHRIVFPGPSLIPLGICPPLDHYTPHTTSGEGCRCIGAL